MPNKPRPENRAHGSACLTIRQRSDPQVPREVQPMMLTEFLLARIAEREALARAAIRDIQNITVGAEPRRVLAECAAKRRIVETCEPIYGADTDWECTDAPELAFIVLRLLAQPDADHPDCRPEWKP